MITAKEYALQNMQGADIGEIESALIGFAKLHVTAALECAAKEAYDSDNDPKVERVVLNSYPLENIK